MDSNMPVCVLSTHTQTLQALRDIADWAEDLYLAYAWISSGGGKAEHWQALPLEKIRQAVVGIQFAQTDPEALKQLARRANRLKVINDPDGVFHPKVILGVKGREGKALLGSSNFTVGGFSGNTELNVLLTGFIDAPPLADVLAFINAQWQSVRAFQPDIAWILEYSDVHNKRPKPPRVPSKKPATTINTKSELNIPWSSYFRLLAEQERRTLAYGDDLRIFDHPKGSYLQEVENCRAAFEAHASFADMPLDDRQLVAGWGSRTYGWFGRMGAAGEFKKMTAKTPQVIAEHLDKIPLQGTVSEDLLKTYLTGILKVRRTGIATVSRLLTVKRPDLFLSCNHANEDCIKQVFGFIPRTYKHYLELHRQIWSFPWFKSPRPDGVDEYRVWQARVALLDALLYEG